MESARCWCICGFFAEDGDVVNVLGWWWKSRAEIRSKLTDAFAFVFSDSTLTIAEVHVRLLDLRTAIAHVRWTLDGAKTRPVRQSRRAKESSCRCFGRLRSMADRELPEYKQRRRGSVSKGPATEVNP